MAAWIDQDRPLESAAIAARDNNRGMPECLKLLNKVDNRRGLSCSTCVYIAHAYHGRVQIDRLCTRQSARCAKRVKSSQRGKKHRLPAAWAEPEAGRLHQLSSR